MIDLNDDDEKLSVAWIKSTGALADGEGGKILWRHIYSCFYTMGTLLLFLVVFVLHGIRSSLEYETATQHTLGGPSALRS